MVKSQAPKPDSPGLKTWSITACRVALGKSPHGALGLSFLIREIEEIIVPPP